MSSKVSRDYETLAYNTSLEDGKETRNRPIAKFGPIPVLFLEVTPVDNRL